MEKKIFILFMYPKGQRLNRIICGVFDSKVEADFWCQKIQDNNPDILFEDDWEFLLADYIINYEIDPFKAIRENES